MSNFHTLSGLTQKESQDSRTRVFEGNGTPFLRVPGLVQPERVRIGTQEIPLAEERAYATDSTGTRFENKTEALISVELHPEDGTPILLRSTLSNDGVWQDGAQIYVTGEFVDDAKTNDENDTNVDDTDTGETHDA